MAHTAQFTPSPAAWQSDSRAGRAVGTAAVVAGAVAVNLLVIEPAWRSGHAAHVVVHLAMAGALAAAGQVMARDPALRSIGRLLVLAGYLQAIPVLSWQDAGPAAWLSWVFGPVMIVPIGVVLLAYPRGWLSREVEWWWIVAAAGWLFAGRLVTGLFPPTESTHGWWPTVFHDTTVRTIVDAVYNVGGLCLVALFAILLQQRWVRSAHLDRFVDAPLAVAAIAVGVTAATHLLAFLAGGVSRGGWPAIVQDLALTAVPLSFIAVALTRQLLYASVASALVNLPAAATPSDVQNALAASLHDPDVEVLYWVDDIDGYVDGSGNPAATATSPRRLDITSQASDGSPLAIVRVDAATHRYPELLASALRLGALALENTRLQAALLAQLQEVRQSRTRILEATLTERRRIERDLHDGAQQRLLAVSATLGRLHRATIERSRLDIVDEARNELRVALKDLRDLAHGIHPAELTEGGLRPAIDSAAEGLPVAVRVNIPERRWPQNVEATAYFVACEALTNAAKHSGATIVDVIVDGEESLELAIFDDGVGGADDTGSGLRGMRDRVAALGGDITVTSPPNAGTRIEVRLPCG